MASGAAAGQRVHATLQAAMRRFLDRGLASAGIVRHDPKVADAIRAQVPLLTRHPTSPAGSDVAAVAQSLAG
jgi:flagellar biosynthesis protein FlhG